MDYPFGELGSLTFCDITQNFRRDKYSELKGSDESVVT
jgi:hypothetical protein